MNDALFRPSSMLRRSKCPGSLALESTLPESGDDDDEYRSEGRYLHSLVADPSLPRDECKPQQLELVESVEMAEMEVLKRVGADAPAIIHHTETTFSFVINDGVFFSGTPDSVWVFKKPSVAVVSDRKFGFKAVQQADANLQLRTYLAMIADVYPVDLYYGIITQPRVSHKPFVVCYTPVDIARSRRDIEGYWNACHAPDAPRRPSPDGCEFCRAQAVCPEFKSWAFALEKSAHLPSAQWSDETWSEFLTKRPIVEKFCKERLEDAKLIKAANPDRLPGWVLRPGAEVRHCTDAIKAWASLEFLLTQAFGKDAAKKFSACCSLAIGDLEDLVWSLHKDDPKKKISQKEAKRIINQLLADTIEKRRNKPSLVKDE
jgi:hypothetical protein